MSWEQIPGWSSFLWAYDEMVERAVDGDTIVEIGVAFGRSVAYLARRVIDSGKDIRVVAVDPWEPRWDPHPDHPQGIGWGGEHAWIVEKEGGPFNAFVSMMRAHARTEFERITVMRCTSQEVAAIADRCEWRCAGVLIDGSHHYEDVRNDLRHWDHLAKGIIAGDDWSEREFPGVCKAVRETYGVAFETRGTTWIKRK